MDLAEDILCHEPCPVPQAMRRVGAGSERQADGSWSIPQDHLTRTEIFAQR